MTTADFIDLLEHQRLAPDNVLRQLRAKAAQGDERITPKSILKYLVKKEVVSRTQAKELLETTITVTDKAESSILGLVPLVDIGDAPKPSRSAPPPPEPAPEPPASREVQSRARSAPVEPTPLPTGDDLFSPTPASKSLFDDDEPVVLDPINSPALAEPRSAAGSKLRPASRAKKSKPTPKSKNKGAKLGERSQWDSPLLLMGGAGLAVLVLGSAVLWYLLVYESADEKLTLANDAFDRGSYQAAAGLYKEFADKFSNHDQSSWAKVRREMSKLWEAAESRNFAGAADMAPTTISQIEDEPAFVSNADESDKLSTAKQELSVLLPRIAAGLAEQAESTDDDELALKRIEQANVILELSSNTKYVPEEVRQGTQLDDVRGRLARVETRLKRNTELSAALAQMDEQIEAGQPAAALKIRAALLVNYPMLTDDAALKERLQQAAGGERSLVKFVESRQPATTEPAPTQVVAELALADRRGEAADVTGLVVVQIDGGVYALDAKDGSLRWRRFVGLGGVAQPLLLPGGNVIAADVQRGELVCVNAQTGKLVWRLPLEGTLATPTPIGAQLLVASDAGKLYVVEQAAGELLGYVEFNQPLRLPPAVNDAGDRIYVLGEHSNIYTLAGSDFSCLGVHYLGHAAGGVAVSPVVALNKVIVADNSGAETCRIRALALNDQSVIADEVASHRLAGLVTTPLQSAGRRVAAITTLGQAAVFEAGGGNDKTALTVLASREAQNEEPLAQFALLHEGHLWVAGRLLTKLAILPTGNQLPVRSLDRDYRGDAFDYPLQAIGDVVLHLRRPAGGVGAIVAAIDDEAHPLWETHLAVPPAGPPAVDASGLRITAGAASGVIYVLDREAMTRRVQNVAQRLEGVAAELPVLTDALSLNQGRLVLGGIGGNRLLHFRPGDPRQSLKAVDLAGPLSCSPVAWRDGFVAATDVGQVSLHNAEDAAPLGAPFQPELTPGREYHWLGPAVAGSTADSPLIISDGVRNLHVLELQPQPQPHLEATVTADVGGTPLVTPLAVAGNRVFAGTESGLLASYNLPDLIANEPIALNGRVAWGPYPAGDAVLLGLESGELVSVGGDGAIRWRQSLKRGQLGGTPLIDGDNALLLVPTAGIARIALGDGAEVAYTELGQPAIAGPVAFGPRLVVAAPDGTLLIVNRP